MADFLELFVCESICNIFRLVELYNENKRCAFVILNFIVFFKLRVL